MNGPLGSAGCKPFFELYNVKGVENELIYTNKGDSEEVKWYSSKASKNDNSGVITFKFKKPLAIYGNILIKFKHIGSLTVVSNICRLTFNTAFVPYTNKLNFDRD
jgi:hypothetical protein